MATNHCFLWVLLLLMILVPWPHSGNLGVCGLKLGAKEDTNSSSRVLVALNYPSIQIGPYSWRYFRVEVPQAFAELSILLTRKWTGEHIGNLEAKVPMVCFRFGSPPLPESVLESPQAAAIAAGKSENLSGTGKCAWFHGNTSVSLTNMQILAGVWYVGVFSDPRPSRFQSKMIQRGSIFTFGIHFTIFGCKSPNLRGHDCVVTIKPLYYQPSTLDLNIQKMSKFSLETILTQRGPNLTNDLLDLNKQSTKFVIEGEEAWQSLTLEHISPKTWKYYVLEVVDFSLKLEVQALCRSCNSTSKELNETTEAYIYVKYGALPNENDKVSPLGLTPITIPVPRRGLWYIGVYNSNTTEPLDFDLHYHVESCSYGGAEGSCALAINSMERVLVEDANESPFNSFYGPAREESLLYSPWFSLSNMTHIGNETSGNWTYFFVEVPRGASGAVLSVQLRHVIKATMSVYARLEGFATPEHWDISVVNVGEKKNQQVSLDLVYPAEGTWCIGVHHEKHFAFANQTSLEDIPQHGGIISSRVFQLWANTLNTVLHWYQTFKVWLEMSWREVCNRVYPYKAQETSSFLENVTSEETRALNQSVFEVFSKRHDSDVQVHISVHGCMNKCSGRGHCTTSYESSRLHYYSYCHCDAAHGGIDCSVPLVVPRAQSLHLWALIGSNFAALLPSVWAMRNKAYSEWVSYSASGLASGFYHSCDAGGWCALSYDTLQFLDFWLAFLVIVVTCVYVASLKQEIKAVAHVGTAIITAAITKENATSAWNILVVGLMGLAGLLLGWALECWRLHLIPSCLSAIGPTQPVLRLESLYHRGEQLLGCLKTRFRWFYLSAGLGILIAAGMSWVLETADTYWLWHSMWHIGIYSSAFLILCSTSKSADIAEANSEGYQSDPEASPMLRDTVELDAFANPRSRDD
ncbi:hypothetical protein KC19_2G242600 [Ceratodon purpureus]|uniref:EGF-like domain-containing protein n=1 Tax=Ceratodon purpureus TaxID=3225 RepID=A0A8T0J095_CERPU|nr:hypothetical protein KC19_2G242600 [Ceratodon purpureus]